MPPDWTFDWYEHSPGNAPIMPVPNRTDRRRAARKRKAARHPERT